METDQGRHPRIRAVAVRPALAVVGLGLGLLLAELALAALGKPRFYKAHSSAMPFAFYKAPDSDHWFYVGKPSARVRFVYDGNPRGYFGDDNEVDHFTNSRGFRGRELSTAKPQGTVRIAFLGDSFTFGEGVRFEDTFAEKVSALLGEEFAGTPVIFESYNFGVGGYNTTQALFAMGAWVPRISPDVVVLGYVLNDAEPPLYDLDRTTGQYIRRPREADIPEGRDDPHPPDTLLYKLRTARLIWQVGRNRQRTTRMADYYRSLYEESNPGWAESRRALGELIALCNQRGITCCVLCFPILVDLDDDYPFADIHAKIGQQVERAGGIFVDLLPDLRGMNAADLWVHPTDQHPNEVVHGIAAKAIVEALRSTRPLAQLQPTEPAGD